MRILQDGTVEIRNKRTGETKIVQPQELPNFGIPYSTFEKELKSFKSVGGETEIPTPKTTEQVKQAGKYSDVEKSINLLEQNLKQAELKGPASRPLAFINSLTSGSIFPETADYNSLRKSLIGPLARTISGEVGVLTDKDIARAEGLLPKLTDAAKVRENKLNNLRQLLAEKQGKQFTPASMEEGQQTGRNPIVNFLLGGAMNVAQDVGTGIRSKMEQPNLQKNEQMAKQFEDQAYSTNDMEQRKLLLQQANQIRQSISQEAGDISKSFSPDVKGDVASRSFGAASQIATLLSIPGVAKGTLKVGSKILHPFRSVGQVRAAAVASAQGKTVAGDKIISGLEKATKTLSPADQRGYSSFVETAKQAYKGKDLILDDILKINHEANKAYNAAGVAGKSAKAAFNETLGKILKSELALKAPEVAKANKLFELLYKTQKIGGKFGGGAARQAVGTGATIGILKVLGL